MAEFKQVSGVSPKEVYDEDLASNLGRLGTFGPTTYKFVKFSSGTYCLRGDALAITSANVASKVAGNVINGIAVCDVDARSADKYTLVIVGSEGQVPVNVGGLSSTTTADVTYSDLPLVYSSAGNLKDGTITTTTATSYAVLSTELLAMNNSPLVGAGSGSISGASAYRLLDPDVNWTVQNGVVSSTATADIAASAEMIAPGDILTVSGSASYENQVVTATATGASGIIINVATAYGAQITAGTYSGDVNVYVSVKQAPAIFK